MTVPKVAVAMSGGVDSSVAAHLIMEQGMDAFGITMMVGASETARAAEDAASVCRQLGIPHYVVDLRQAFEDLIVNEFCQEYLGGRTPNPCVTCNRLIKFGALMEKATALGAEFMATGHYVQVCYEPECGRYLLKKGVDTGKDQSYFLYGLRQDQLARARFPLGLLKKDEVRERARRLGLPTAERSESQEICFITGNYRDFLAQRGCGSGKSGSFIDKDGNVLGRHRGICHYTIGQRRGLGVSCGVPVYVAKIDSDTGNIVLAEEKDLWAKTLIAGKVNWIAIERLTDEIKVEAKIRYAAKPARARVIPEREDRVRVVFDKPQRAITPGQSVVFYWNDTVVGGGVIEGVGD